MGKNCFKSIHKSEVRNIIHRKFGLGPHPIEPCSGSFVECKEMKLQMYYKYYQFHKAWTRFETLMIVGGGHMLGSEFSTVWEVKTILPQCLERRVHAIQKCTLQ